MEEKTTIEVTLEEARKLYKSNNTTLKEMALRCYTKDELDPMSFDKIKTYHDAIQALGLDKDKIQQTVRVIEKTSIASAAMFKLSIVRKALNAGHQLPLVKNQFLSILWKPYNPIVSDLSTYYEFDFQKGKNEPIGAIMIENTEYKVISAGAVWSGSSNLCCFNTEIEVGFAYIDTALLGCATEEIAKHFSKYFGMLITEAKYGDFPDFQITARIY
nr:MAG TPA: hypothetical protein [Caudoviricetes sp.]